MKKLIDDAIGWWYFAAAAERADMVVGVLSTASILAIVAYEAWRMTT